MNVRIALGLREDFIAAGFEPNGSLQINGCCDVEVWRNGHEEKVVQATRVCRSCLEMIGELVHDDNSRAFLFRD